jgi:hypothetical protein
MHCTCPLMTQSGHRECSAKCLLPDFYSIYSVDDLKDVRGLTLAVSRTSRAYGRGRPLNAPSAFIHPCQPIVGAALEQAHVAVNSILRDCGQSAQHSTNPDGRAWGAK